MKKIINKIVLLLLVLISISASYKSIAATTATVSLKSNKETIEKGEEVEISINITGQKTASYLANLYFDDTKLEFISGPENINVDKNNIKILWYDEQGGSGARLGELDKIVFKAKDNGIANLVISGEFYTDKAQLIQTKFESIQLQVGREETALEIQAKEEIGDNRETNNANLEQFRVNIEGIIPEFKSDIYQYDLTVSNDINDIEVLAIPENPNAQIEVMGNIRIKTRAKYNKN